MTLIDKILAFENAPEQTVCEFNKIFHSDGLTFGNLEDEVAIGKPLGPVNVRALTVGGKEYAHSFSIPQTLSLPGGNDHIAFSEKGALTVTTNDQLENSILEEKEMEMDSFEYKLLQYFRGSESPYHTQEGIALRLKVSARGVRNVLKRMEQGGIIKTQNVAKLHRMYITIQDEWV